MRPILSAAVGALLWPDRDRLHPDTVARLVAPAQDADQGWRAYPAADDDVAVSPDAMSVTFDPDDTDRKTP